MSEAHRATKAVICLGHHMMYQNPKAVLKTKKAEIEFFKLITAWADDRYVNGQRIYWHTGYSVEMLPTHNEDDESVRKLN